MKRVAKYCIAATLTICFSVFGFAQQADSIAEIKVHFLYGSKPKRKYKDQELKYFGGLHGGHVSIEINGVDYGFEPNRGFHVLARRKKFKSAYVANRLMGRPRYGSNSKTATVFLPVTSAQANAMENKLKGYCEQPPYDYAFLGMRCASSVHEVLSSAGIVKPRKRAWNIISTFYPKKLRKRLLKLAKQKNYIVIFNAGRQTRKWEKD